ncbi:hypothetical protein F5Y11DRAFT_365210 [Daldinia sp. FL1419]|nr:hypothetical protein F5Y11DRAFT_365210 [Daldinia sp. FL1419]
MEFEGAVGPNGVVEFDTEDGCDVLVVLEGDPKALLLSTELGKGKVSDPGLTVPPDGAAGLVSVVAFVVGKGGTGGDAPDVMVETPVPEIKLRVVESTLPDVAVLGTDSEGELELDPGGIPDWPDGLFDEAVGPRLLVEFVKEKGGVNPEAVGAVGLGKPVLGLVVKGVIVSGRVKLEELIGPVREPLGRLCNPVENPNALVGLFVTFVEFGMGKGADELGIGTEALLETPEGIIPVELLILIVRLPESTVEFAAEPVGMGAELKDTGPGPVGIRLPEDPNVGVVAFGSGKGADEPPVPTDCPFGLPEGVPDEARVKVDDKLLETAGVVNVPGFEAPVGPVIDGVELVIGNGVIWEPLGEEWLNGGDCIVWLLLGGVDGVWLNIPVLRGELMTPVECPVIDIVELDHGVPVGIPVPRVREDDIVIADWFREGDTPGVMLDKAVPVGPEGGAVEFVIGNGGNVEENPKLAGSLERLDSSTDDLLDAIVDNEPGFEVPEIE